MFNKNFLIRLITGFCLLAVLIPAVYFGGVFFLIVTTFLGIVATYELMDMFYKKNDKLKTMRFIMPIFSGLTVVAFYYAVTKGYVALGFVPVVLGVIAAMAFGVFKDGTDSSDIVCCIGSLIYGGLLLACAVSVEYISPIQSASAPLTKTAGRMFAFLYSIVVCTDVFAYLFGCAFGKHRLCVKISPKKSVEGAVAGLVLGAAVGTLVGILLKVVPYHTIEGTTNKILLILAVYVVALMISASAQIGDLVASKLKRSYEIKDYGFIFPGHGGVMDRFDSLIFSGALFFIIMQVVYLFV